jgi:3-dehydroquinate synthetase
MIDQTLELLMSQIEDKRKQMLEGLGDGAAKDYASYQNAAGYIRGLLTAQSMIADLAKRMEIDND